MDIIYVTIVSTKKDYLFSNGRNSLKIVKIIKVGSWKELKQTFHMHTGCPKKMQFSGVLAITPIWKVLGTKVGWFFKNSGNSLSDRHKYFAI